MKSTPDNIVAPKAGEPIRHSFLNALAERGRSVAFPRGVVAAGARAQGTEPRPYDYAKIRIQNDSEDTVVAGDALQIDGVLNAGEVAEDYLRLNVPPRRVFHGRVADNDSPIFAIVQSDVPPGGTCNAILSGYSVARIRLNVSTHEFAELRKEATLLESCESGPVRILTHGDGNDGDTVYGFVRFEFGESGLLCTNLTENFDTHNSSTPAEMQPFGTEEESDVVLVQSEISGTDLEPIEFSWKLPAGALCVVESSKVKTSRTPEFSGKLRNNATGGDSTPTIVDFDKGLVFNGENAVSAYPAPNITVGTVLLQDTPVVVRWNHALGKWFFFSHTGGGKCHTLVTCSGDALNGFGVHDDGISIWATQLALNSVGVNNLTITAVLHTVEAVASDDDTPWIRFPTEYGGYGVINQIDYVRGDYYRTTAVGGARKIILKDDYWERYGDFRWTGLYLHDERLYHKIGTPHTSGEYVYNDGYNRWMRGTIGLVHGEGGGYQTVEDATASQLYERPEWVFQNSNTDRGLYHSNNSAEVFQFGRERWEVTSHIPYETNNGIFQRSWTRKEYGYNILKWHYLGSVWSSNMDNHSYKNITPHGEKLVLGKEHDADWGWFEANIPQLPKDETEVTFTFCAIEKEDKTFTPSQIMDGTWMQQNGALKESNLSDFTGVYEQARVLEDTPVAQWIIRYSELNDTFTARFILPENASSNAIQRPNVTFTVKNVFTGFNFNIPTRNFPKSKKVIGDKTYWIFGTYGDPLGWYQVDDEDLQQEYTLEYTIRHVDDLTIVFKDYEGDTETEKVWMISPEILT